MAPPPKLNPKKGTMPVLQWMPPHMLAVDPSYQRSVDNPQSQKLIVKIAKDWDWDLCQPLVVSRRPDGSQWIVDGQHRLAAAVLRGDIEQLPCFICNYPDAATEAQRFVDFNRNRKALKPLDLWKAAVAAEEPETMDIVRALDAAGLHVHGSSNNKNMQPGGITSIGALQRICKHSGINILAVTLKAVGEAFAGQGLQYSGTLINGTVGIISHECTNASAKSWAEGHRYGLLVDCLAASSQREWFEECASTKQAFPDLNYQNASAKAFVNAWRDYTGAVTGEDEEEAAAA